MKDREKYALGDGPDDHERFEALQDFVRAQFAQGVSAADALGAVRMKAVELGMSVQFPPGVEARPRLRLISEH